MQINSISIDRNFFPTWLRYLVVLLLILGISLRFINLGKQVYWLDEAATSFRLSGHNVGELRKQLFNGQVTTVEALKSYQRINSEKNLVDILEGLALEEPQLPPLYYTILYYWSKLFGDSIQAIRSLSAFISLLAFPSMYWLCKELFNSSLASGLGVAFIGISPFFYIYSQEARLYSLWTVTILLSSAALLKAVQTNNKISWLVYFVSLTIAFYTYPLSALVCFGHGVYILGLRGIQFKKNLIAYIITSFSALILFLPWIFIITSNIQATDTVTEWTSSSKIPWQLTIFSFLVNIIRVFFDVPSALLWKYSPDYYEKTDIIISIIFFLLLLLICFSIYTLCRYSQVKTWLFIINLIVITPMVLMIPDFILGGIRSIFPRFQIPCYIGLLLGIVYLLTISLNPKTKFLFGRKFWRVVTLALTVSAITSCSVIMQSQVWWNKYFSNDNLPISSIINESQPSLLVVYSGSNNDFYEPKYYIFSILSLSHYLQPNIPVQLLPKIEVETELANIDSRLDKILLFNPSDKFRKILEDKLEFAVDLVYRQDKFVDRAGISLWELNKKPEIAK